MNENVLVKVEKVERLQDELLVIYSEIFVVLKGIDRSEFEEEPLRNLDIALEPPNTIEIPKSIAILKAIRGSTPGVDKFQLEYFYGVKYDLERSVGNYIQHKMDELEIGYHDLYPYLRSKGWITER